jgi:serine/threonine-protein kinase HipA
MRLVAARIGLDVAPVEAYPVANRCCLLVTRYDRRTGPDADVRRLHQEDFCQALGVVADRKYAADGLALTV